MAGPNGRPAKRCAHENLPTHLPTHQKSIGSNWCSHTTFGRQTDWSGQRSSFDQTIVPKPGLFSGEIVASALKILGWLSVHWLECTGRTAGGSGRTLRAVRLAGPDGRPAKRVSARKSSHTSKVHRVKLVLPHNIWQATDWSGQRSSFDQTIVLKLWIVFQIIVHNALKILGWLSVHWLDCTGRTAGGSGRTRRTIRLAGPADQPAKRVRARKSSHTSSHTSKVHRVKLVLPHNIWRGNRLERSTLLF